MIHNTLNRLEMRIADATGVPKEKRSELLKLIAKLRTELQAISKHDPENAETIASFAHLTAHEKLKKKTNPKLVQTSESGLEESLVDFRASNPQLAAIIDDILNVLSASGI
ncbi:MAG: DUF4404 family protein [Candidatus Margulisiibacteriota bacterium]